MKCHVAASILTLTLCGVASLGAAQKKEAPKTGELCVAPAVRSFEVAPKTEAEKKFAEAQKAIVGKPMMVTVLRNGKPVQQREMRVERWDTWVFPFRDLPFGTYSLKFEAVGVETLVKSGYVVSATSGPVAVADLVAGKGTRHVRYGEKKEYDVEKLLGRIKELEAEVERLKASK